MAKKKHFKRIGSEFIPVFLGVIAAMFLGNLKEGRQESKFIDSSLGYIYENNCANIDKLEDELFNHRSFRDSTYVHGKDKMTILKIISSVNGWQMKTKTMIGWQMLKNSPLLYKVDYDIVSMLSTIETSLDKNFPIMNARVIKTLENHSESNDPIIKDRLHRACRDYIGSINDLIGSIKRTNTLIRKKLDTEVQAKYESSSIKLDSLEQTAINNKRDSLKNRLKLIRKRNSL